MVTTRFAVISAAVSMLVLTLLVVSIVTPVVLAQSSATACNGAAALCGRRYSNVSQVGAHDSAFVGDSLADNQELGVTEQLDAGVRFLQGQTHKNPIVSTQLDLCHTSCFLRDAGSLQAYLATVKTWLDANKEQVLTLLLTNGDSVDVAMFDTAFEGSGLKSYAFVPSTSPNTLAFDAWPTLQELIDAGTRLVVFLDYGADTSKVDYILPEFDYFFETPFDTTDPDFAECTLDRPGGASPDGRMYIVNHFLDESVFGILIPDKEALADTNAATGTGSIGAQADLCTAIYGRVPNFVLLDFFDIGDAFTAQNTLNGL